MQHYRNRNGIRSSRRAQSLAAKTIIPILLTLIAVASCAPLGSARAQDSNASIPPYQRCDLLARVALTAVQARDAGRVEQDLHIQLDQIDPQAAQVISTWYSKPRAMNASPELAADVTRSACQRKNF